MKKLTRFNILLVVALYALLAQSALADNALRFAKEYIKKIDSQATTEQYLAYLVTPLQKQLLKKPKKLKRDYEEAVRMHAFFLKDGSINSKPSKFSPAKGIVSYTFQLNKPVPNTKIYPNSRVAKHNLTEYQITLQKENKTWRVTGETFVGTL